MYIHGVKETRTIRVGGRILYPDYSQEIFNHSPDGFSWGYHGSGCAQLSLAILLTVTDPDTAVRLHQDFKRKFIASLPIDDDFEIELDPEVYIKNNGGEVSYNGIRKSFFVAKVRTLFGEAVCTTGHDESCQCAKAEHCDCTCGGVNHGIKNPQKKGGDSL